VRKKGALGAFALRSISRVADVLDALRENSAVLSNKSLHAPNYFNERVIKSTRPRKNTVKISHRVIEICVEICAV
jgi:hypothetical protein